MGSSMSCARYRNPAVVVLSLHFSTAVGSVKKETFLVLFTLLLKCWEQSSSKMGAGRLVFFFFFLFVSKRALGVVVGGPHLSE